MIKTSIKILINTDPANNIVPPPTEVEAKKYWFYRVDAIFRNSILLSFMNISRSFFSRLSNFSSLFQAGSLLLRTRYSKIKQYSTINGLSSPVLYQHILSLLIDNSRIFLGHNIPLEIFQYSLHLHNKHTQCKHHNNH